MTFMTLVSQLVCRMPPPNLVCVMFPHDSVHVMQLWQEYYRNDVVLSLHSFNGT